MTPPVESEAILVDLLSLRIEAWFRDARNRARCWEPAPCPATYVPRRGDGR